MVRPGTVEESVTVTNNPPPVIPESDAALRTEDRTAVREPSQRSMGQRDAQQKAAPSANVQNLQRRASGVLPVRIEIPRAGSSHRFIKPLVVDEETVVTFRYRRMGK